MAILRLDVTNENGTFCSRGVDCSEGTSVSDDQSVLSYPVLVNIFAGVDDGTLLWSLASGSMIG
jgi:hypothetical protein